MDKITLPEGVSEMTIWSQPKDIPKKLSIGIDVGRGIDRTAKSLVTMSSSGITSVDMSPSKLQLHVANGSLSEILSIISCGFSTFESIITTSLTDE